MCATALSDAARIVSRHSDVHFYATPSRTPSAFRRDPPHSRASSGGPATKAEQSVPALLKGTRMCNRQALPNEPRRVESDLFMKTTSHFAFRVDIWDDSGGSNVERIAGVERG